MLPRGRGRQTGRRREDRLPRLARRLAAGDIVLPTLIAAAGRVDLRRAAELAHGHDHRVLEQAALLQVLEQRAVRLVEHRPDQVAISLIVGERPEPWMSQVISSKTVSNMLTVTNRTPASISRRASRQLWPKRLRP